ncbi:MAG: Ig-like domain-containing protein, partial [Treponemataceae bacterium]
ITATIVPLNATNKTLVWDIEDKTIATLTPERSIVRGNHTKTIVGLKEGSTKITVTSEDGLIRAECIINVITYKITVESVALGSGEKGFAVVSTEPSGGVLSWESLDQNIAMVDVTTGEIKAFSGGTARLTASTKGVTEEFEVKVTGLEYTLNSGSYAVSGIGTYTNTHLVTLDELHGVAVTQISAQAFKSEHNITSVVIGEKITTLGMNAFNDAINLTDVYVDNNDIAWLPTTDSDLYENAFTVYVKETIPPLSEETFIKDKFPGQRDKINGYIPYQDITTGKIATGDNHSLAVSKKRNLFSWGLNWDGQLGLGTTSAREPSPNHIKSFTERIDVIASGQFHSLTLTRTGKVYTWGRNESGQIGNGSTGETESSPYHVASITEKIIAIGSGDNHNLAVTVDGKVYAWGLNRDGQIGNGSSGINEKEPLPQLIDSIAELVIAVEAGIAHSLALTRDGKVYAWGSNTNGQIGNGRSGGHVTTPWHVAPITEKIIAISAGDNHSLAVTAKGEVYIWGSNTFGQIGNGFTSSTVSTPEKLTTISDVISISGGGGHTLALTRDGKVYAWGSNSDGQIGNGSSGETQSTPYHVEKIKEKVSGIDAGLFHSIALTDDMSVYVWGLNSNGQIGNGSTSESEPFPIEIALD